MPDKVPLQPSEKQSYIKRNSDTEIHWNVLCPTVEFDILLVRNMMVKSKGTPS